MQVDAQDALAGDRADIGAIGPGGDWDGPGVGEAGGLERRCGIGIGEEEVPLEADHRGQIAEQLDRFTAVDVATRKTERLLANRTGGDLDRRHIIRLACQGDRGGDQPEREDDRQGEERRHGPDSRHPGHGTSSARTRSPS